MADHSIYIAGHRGLAGSALLRLYARRAGWRVIPRTHAELELKDTTAVRAFFQQERPSHVILAAAKVGGIKANASAQVEFLLDNLRIQNNVIEAAADSGEPLQVLLLAAEPIGEPVARYGPFVMNTREEIEQAFDDYRSGRMGTIAH